MVPVNPPVSADPTPAAPTQDALSERVRELAAAELAASPADAPRLRVRSRFADGLEPEAPGPFAGRLPASAQEFLALLPTSSMSAWVRGTQGLVGVGRTLRLVASGPDRFADLSAAWQALVAAAEVDDGVEILGSGLLGFSAIAFAADSEVESVVDVPAFLLGRRDGRVWLTSIEWAGAEAGSSAAAGSAPSRSGAAGSGADEDPLVLAPTPLSMPSGVRVRAGEVSPDRYEEIVAAAVERLRDPAAPEHKVVLARDEVVEADDDIDVRLLLGRLNAAFPSCWTFDVAGLVGATPELLIGVERGEVRSRVLAGTYRVVEDAAAELPAARAQLSGAKDTSEHAFAVESLRRSLSAVAPDLRVDAEPHLLQLTNVIHLASDAHGHLADGMSPFDVAAAVHPTAAVGGAPTAEALELLAELEGMDRGRFAGPVGWVDGYGSGQFGIALRCGQLESRRSIRLFAGAGIMPDSDPASEREETAAKLSPMRRALGVDA